MVIKNYVSLFDIIRSRYVEANISLYHKYVYFCYYYEYMYEFMSIRKNIIALLICLYHVLSNVIVIVLSQVNVHHSGQQVTVDRPFDKFSVTTACMM